MQKLFIQKSFNAIVNQSDVKRNLHRKTSRAYHACQLKLLQEEILFKQSRMKTLEKDFNPQKRKLGRRLGIIYYTHVCCLFLNKNDKKLKNQQDIHSKKLFNLGMSHLKRHTTVKRYYLIILLMY